ncbi:hypothetical protein Q9R20_06440 [Microbacterium sp. PRF11]|uniref:hypothetical protein n=1 Tax=Microbacterium sp. PRF11 TaxID=2962593 RepID=UPI00288187C8|nr:hypothetical protein [Microbacterium sp. PRF11]MDT0116626.1 hypothetical protein [Microbacterium sp. PRF11]
MDIPTEDIRHVVVTVGEAEPDSVIPHDAHWTATLEFVAFDGRTQTVQTVLNASAAPEKPEAVAAAIHAEIDKRYVITTDLSDFEYDLSQVTVEIRWSGN